jgi:cystathionine beta-lyase
MQIKYSFSTSAPRENTNAEKYVLRQKLFGTEDVLPAWVADMDIDTPHFVLEAVKKRLEHPVMGYEEVSEGAFAAQIAWMQKRHGVSFAREELLYSHSVVASMNATIEAFTKEGEGVIVQTPVYPPFFHAVRELNRKLVLNPLKRLACGSYTFDIEDLKAKITSDTKLLLLSSPHNPVGRVWKREELEAVLEVCATHNIVVFADEIHSDLVFAPHKHTPFVSLSPRARELTITAIGTGKTFNMAGFAMSSVAICDKELRGRFEKVYKKIHFAHGCSLSHVAFEAAYKEGDAWLEALKIHLMRNYAALQAVCEKFPHAIKLTPLEGTYLAWLDCRGMGLSDKELREFFVREAKLGLSAGMSFGREGSGYMRLNFAVASDTMSQIIQRLQNALAKRFHTP